MSGDGFLSSIGCRRFGHERRHHARADGKKGKKRFKGGPMFGFGVFGQKKRRDADRMICKKQGAQTISLSRKNKEERVNRRGIL